MAFRFEKLETFKPDVVQSSPDFPPKIRRWPTTAATPNLSGCYTVEDPWVDYIDG
jgi:hypothetical protein